MPQPLRVLILEDSELDAQLMLHKLREAGYEPEWQRVISENEFRAALKPELDIILADYSLPQWTALEALHVLNESQLDVPFIIVTGSVSEEVAVQCMRSGASDYLLKDRLGRLGSAVAQAIENRHLHRQQQAYEAALINAAEEWRQTFDAMTDMITVQDRDFRIMRANRAAVEAMGTTFEEILGRQCFDIFHGLNCPIANCPFVRTQETGRSEESIIWEPTMNKWLMVKTNPMWDSDGELAGVVHVMRDITQMIETEQALRASEERYRNLLDTSLVGIFIAQDYTIKYCNQGLAEILGYESPAELHGVAIKSFTYPDDYPLVAMEADMRVPGSTGRRYRFRGLRKDGSIVYLEALGRVIEYEDRPAIQSFVIDVTPQITAEREREMRNRQQAEVAQFGQVALAGMPLTSLMNMAAKTVAETLAVDFSAVLQWHPESEQLLLAAGVGWRTDELSQTTLTASTDFHAGYTLSRRHPIAVADFSLEERCQPSPLLRQHQIAAGVGVIIQGDTRPFGLLTAYSSQPRTFSQDDIHFIQAIANVLAEAIRQEAAKQALLRSERALSFRNQVAHVLLTAREDQVYLEVLKVVMQALDSQLGLFGFVNDDGNLVIPTFSEEIWEQCRMSDKRNVFPPETWGGLWGRTLKERRTQLENEGMQVPEGHMPVQRAVATPVLYQDQVIGLIMAANREDPYTDEDAALLSSIADYVAPVLHAQLRRQAEEKERKLLEAQYQQVQRLDAIGQLTTGIAHDFNNMLTPIISLSELIRMRTPKNDRTYELAGSIIAAGKRAAELVRQLLAFSRQQVVRPEVLDVADVLAESQSVLTRVISEDIKLHIYTHKKQSFLLMDPTQLQQIVFNLVVNARDAMPTGGDLTISVDNVEIDAEAAAQLSEIEPGPYVRLSISDTGHGMSPEVQARMFEPFFTTKERGQGTGLGLASVYGIVKQNKGDIVCESEEGKGTTFTIYLPRVKAPPTVAEKAAEFDLGWLRGKETILLVEDDDHVREVAMATLKQLGYTVLEAPEGTEALLLARQYEKKIDLMLSDVIMPNIDGVALAEEIRRFRPDIKVLFMSGYPGDVIKRRGTRISDANFIQKPFAPQTLAKHIRALLEHNH